MQDKAQDSHRHGSKLWQLDLEILSEVAKKELGGAALMAGGGVHACAVVWAGIMTQVAVSHSSASSPPRDRTCISCISLSLQADFTAEPPGKSHLYPFGAKQKLNAAFVFCLFNKSENTLDFFRIPKTSTNVGLT